MTDSLSPWTRQMLGDEPGVGTARHTMLNRILRRRARGSSSFPSTLSILRRFHRIVTRSTAWKIGLGAVDPNLFDRFATDLVKRQQIGANNIPSLISLGEQRRREMDMPLAGAIGEISPSSGSEPISANSMASQMGFGAPGVAPAAAPADNKPLTMEEIKRRIEDAKRFKSNTPGSVPDFVKAAQPTNQPKPPSTPQLPPGFPPIPGQPTPPPTIPVPRPPEGINPQSPEIGATQSSAEQRVPPRQRRRRFASVEYVSLPNTDDDESSKDEPDSSWRSATGPPADLAEFLTQWIEPFTQEDAASIPSTRVQRKAQQRTRSIAAPVRPVRAYATLAHRPEGSSAVRGQVMRRRKSIWLPIGATNPSTRTDATIARRPLTRLAEALSGKVLVSRPQKLMAQVLRKETVAPQIANDTPQDRISFMPAARPPVTLDEIGLRSAVGRIEARGLHLPASRWLSISADDFALAPPLRLRRRREDVDDARTEEGLILPTALSTQRTRLSPLPQRAERSPQVQRDTRSVPPSARVSSMPVAATVLDPRIDRSDARVQHRRHTTRPSTRRRLDDSQDTLAQLQVASSPLPPTVIEQEPLALSAGRVDRLPPLELGFTPMRALALPRSASPSESVADLLSLAVSRQTSSPRSASPSELIVGAPQARDLPIASSFKRPFQSLVQLDAGPDFVARRTLAATSRQVSNHTQAITGRSPLNRAFQHLAGAMSGQILASRPQALMAQVLAPERNWPSHQSSGAASQQRMPSTLDMMRFSTPVDASLSWEGRSLSAPLPISVDDFVLPPIRRREQPEESGEPLLQSGTNAVRTTMATPAVFVQRRDSSTLGTPLPRVTRVGHRRRIESSRPGSRVVTQADASIRAGSATPNEMKIRPDLVRLQATPLIRPTTAESRSNLPLHGPLVAVYSERFEPVSALWRRAQFSPQETILPLIQDAAALPAQPGERQQKIRRAPLQVVPLELAMRRLLGSRVTPAQEEHPEQALPQVIGRISPPGSASAPRLQPPPGTRRPPQESPLVPVERLLSEEGREVQRSVARLGRAPQPSLPSSRPHRQPPPTLMERVLNRDFAGARVQAVSTDPSGLHSPLRVERYQRSSEIAAERPSLFSTLTSELAQKSTHGRQVARRVQRQITPLILAPWDLRSPLTRSAAPAASAPATQFVPSEPLILSPDARKPAPSASSAPRPHLTRQLSQRLAQTSQPKPERTVAAMEDVIVRMASSAHIARQFAPSSYAWQPQPSISSRIQMSGSDQRVITVARQADNAVPASPAVHRVTQPPFDLDLPKSSSAPSRPLAHSADQPQRQPIQRAAARLAQSSRTQSGGFDADRVRALLEPGTLSVETLSASSLLQRPKYAQRMLPLTDFVLARADAGQQVRSSQPPLTASPVDTSPVPDSPLRPVQPYSTPDRLDRVPSAQQTVQRRVRTVANQGEERRDHAERRQTVQRRAQTVSLGVDRPLPERDRRRGVQFMAARPERYERIEPVSRIWRSDMLLSPAENQPFDTRFASAIEDWNRPRRSLLSSSETLPLQRQAQIRSSVPTSSSEALPLQRQAQIRSSARTSSSEALPLQRQAQIRSAPPPIPNIQSSIPNIVRRTGIQVADAEQVAEAVALLPIRSRTEQTLRIEAEPDRRTGSLLWEEDEERRQVALGAPPAVRAARLIRRKAASDLPRPTLLERVAARDFADLRREQLAEGPLLLPVDRAASLSSSLHPSPVHAISALTRPESVFPRDWVRQASSSHSLSKELVQRSGLSHYPNLGSSPLRLQPWGSDFDPVSMAWPGQPWIQPFDAQPVDLLPSSRQPVAQRAAAQVIPLELAMRRLLGSDERAAIEEAAPVSGPLPQVVGRTTSPAVVAPMVAQMEERGWRFKRADRVSRTGVNEVKRSVESLGRERSRPLARPARTLMERVLGRDFAGVRVQTASMAPLGLEAAMRGNTVYLSNETARLDRPQSLGVLAHELTHVAARGRQPGQTVQPSSSWGLHLDPAARGRQRGQTVQRQSEPLTVAPRTFYPAVKSPASEVQFAAFFVPGQPVAPEGNIQSAPSPLRPHLTRQLSQRLVQMSLAQEERAAEAVEAAVVKMASTAQVVRRFAPASHLWRMPLFEDNPTPSTPDMDLAELGAPLVGEPRGRAPLRRGSGSGSNLPALDLPSRSRLPAADPTVPSADQGGPGFLTPGQTTPTSVGDRSSGRVGQRLRSSAQMIQPERTVAALEREGWRFKRADRPRLIAPDRIQRAVAQLQQRADRGMPLPRQPRTLMERVLQRDFSRVRVQTAPLQALGVEAAARDNTVYLAREQASRLDRTENLALLGHELTHVAASGNAPVQRAMDAPADLPVIQRRTGDNVNVLRPANAQSVAMPLRPLLPATIQRTLAGEEDAAARVEVGLRTFLRQSSPGEGVERSQSISQRSVQRNTQREGSAMPVIQRTPLRAPRAQSIRSGSEERVQRLAAVDQNDNALPRLGGSPAQLKGFRGGEPTLSGVPSEAMDIAPRTPVIRRMPATETSLSVETSSREMLSPLGSQGTTSSSLIQRNGSSNRPSSSSTPSSSSLSVEKSIQRDPSAASHEEEPDWDRLAEKVYPLIRRMLLLERERRPR
ncbi:MAG: DUF4157 domain-containing protein [Caldilineaceae bacterium]|nr:DUF4157 domain-containing protein [Caldilineaceae bacterium]